MTMTALRLAAYVRVWPTSAPGVEPDGASGKGTEEIVGRWVRRFGSTGPMRGRGSGLRPSGAALPAGIGLGWLRWVWLAVCSQRCLRGSARGARLAEPGGLHGGDGR